MTHPLPREPDPLCYLPHQGRELEGHAPPDAISPEIADRNADLAIREIMAAQRRERKRLSLPELEPPLPPETGGRRAPGVVARGAGRSRRAGWLVLPAIAVLAILWRPWLLPLVLLAVFVGVLIAYLTLGRDRMAGAWRRLARRVDVVFDRLPGSWAARVALPSFTAVKAPSAAPPDPFERLAARQADD